MARKTIMMLATVALFAACSDSASSEAATASKANLLSHRVPVYLALGDSVPFGWSDALAGSTEPWRFVGYPQFLAFGLGMRLLDAACPSEASGSFLSADAPDDGCRAYRATHDLHVQYDGTQLTYALEVVKTSRRLELVTLQLGANDLQILSKSCAGDPQCVAANLPGTVQAIATNVATIIGALREAEYGGQVVVIDYYNPTTDPMQDAVLGALDGALEATATAMGVDFVDLKEPFARAAERVGGDPCATHLIATVNGVCESHPSWAGHLLIATLVARALDQGH